MPFRPYIAEASLPPLNIAYLAYHFHPGGLHHSSPTGGRRLKLRSWGPVIAHCPLHLRALNRIAESALVHPSIRGTPRGPAAQITVPHRVEQPTPTLFR